MAGSDRIAAAVDGDGASFPSPRDVAEWLEALAVRQWVPGRTVNAPSAANLTKAAIGASVLAVRHVCHDRGEPGSRAARKGPPAAGDLVSGEQPPEAVVASLLATARYAQSVRAPWIVVELGPLPRSPEAATQRAAAGLAQLDRACRTLHEVLAQAGDVGVALVTPGGRDDFGRPEELASIFEDLGKRRRIAYWHDSGRAHTIAAAGGGLATEWLTLHGARCIGVDASDALGTIGGLPAGAGEIDFVELRSAVGSAVPFVARVEPFGGPGPLLGAVRHLRGLGL
jgi:hypothetical protein